MFTGLVQSMGMVRWQGGDQSGRRMLIGGAPLVERLSAGDSVAIDGVCLTVTAKEGDGFAVQVGPETLARTTLGQLRPGDMVNLEPALRAGDPLGGHLVTGHVDTVGTIVAEAHEGEWRYVDIRYPSSFADYLAPQGSIAVDGVSLTVVSCTEDHFRVMLIPHTLAVTTLGRKGAGAPVNLEFDLIAKYICRLVHRYVRSANVD
ncbi:MAG: riboflavin synthase subunit alpha [Gemmataceae bacterium]|jgi:riboflavin synthase|nr:MAG: riboflavin synthase subunit alpha [Gemmataceae bacterium]